MTNDTRPTVPPISGHYAMLRNGNVFRHFSPCEYNPEIYRTPMVYNSFWDLNGRAFVEHRPNKKEPWPHADIIATISPESMLATANGSLEILEAELGQCNQDNGDWTYENQLLKAENARLREGLSGAHAGLTTAAKDARTTELCELYTKWADEAWAALKGGEI